jgi:hypothetical protein
VDFAGNPGSDDVRGLHSLLALLIAAHDTSVRYAFTGLLRAGPYNIAQDVYSGGVRLESQTDNCH